MHDAARTSAIVPHAAPDCPYARLLLYGIRRMAAGGLEDAHAAHAFFTGFGLGYRRPLVLLRAMMAELSRVSTVRITVAPCCCPRMTAHEAALVDAVARATVQPDAAHKHLAALLHVRTCLGLVTSAQAVAASFRDMGMPLG